MTRLQSFDQKVCTTFLWCILMFSHKFNVTLTVSYIVANKCFAHVNCNIVLFIKIFVIQISKSVTRYAASSVPAQISLHYNMSNIWAEFSDPCSDRLYKTFPHNQNALEDVRHIVHSYVICIKHYGERCIIWWIVGTQTHTFGYGSRL